MYHLGSFFIVNYANTDFSERSLALKVLTKYNVLLPE